MNKKKEAVLSHIDEHEKASMVDVHEKNITKRIAIASSKVFLNDTSYKLLKKNKSKKGDILNTARIAGIMASKKTSELILSLFLNSLMRLLFNPWCTILFAL